MTPIPKLAELLRLDEELAPTATSRRPGSRRATRSRRSSPSVSRRGPIDEWLAILEPADIWCAKVLNWPELMDSDGFKVLDMLQTVTREDNVSILTTRSPLRVNGVRTKVDRAAPRIGEHSASIRAEFGL